MSFPLILIVNICITVEYPFLVQMLHTHRVRSVWDWSNSDGRDAGGCGHQLVQTSGLKRTMFSEHIIAWLSLATAKDTL